MNVLNTLAYGTALGLGTPQQQRDQVFRESELAQRKALADQELARRREEDAIQGRRWDMQFGNASPEEIAMARPFAESAGVTLPANAAVTRAFLQHLLPIWAAAQQKEQAQPYDPSTWEPVQNAVRQGKDVLIPGQEQEHLEIPSNRPSATPMAGPQGPTEAEPPRKAVMERPSIVEQIRQRREVSAAKAATAQSEQEKDSALSRAAEAIAQGTSPTDAFYQFNLARWGIKLADFAKPDFQKETPEKTKNLEQRYLEILDKDPAQWTVAERRIIAQYEKQHPGQKGETPDDAEAKRLRNELLKMRVETMKESQSADNTLDKVMRGEEVSRAEREKAAKSKVDWARINTQLAQMASPEDMEMYRGEAAKAMKDAKYLREYVQPSTRPNPAATGPVAATKEGFPVKDAAAKLAQRQAITKRLFGGTPWQSLTADQKRKVIDEMTAED